MAALGSAPAAAKMPLSVQQSGCDLLGSVPASQHNPWVCGQEMCMALSGSIKAQVLFTLAPCNPKALLGATGKGKRKGSPGLCWSEPWLDTQAPWGGSVQFLQLAEGVQTRLKC